MTERVKEEMFKSLNSVLIFFSVLFAVSCKDLYFHEFRPVNAEWLPTDTLTYSFVNNGQKRSLFINAELRCTPSFPMRCLWLYVECCGKESGFLLADTVCCEVFDTLGRQNGSTAGLLYQTSFPVGNVLVSPHDTLQIKVAHVMNTPVNEVFDVGIKMITGRVRNQSSEN